MWSAGTRERNAENVNDQGFRIRRVQLLHRPLRRGSCDARSVQDRERIALDIVLPKLDNDADAVAEAVKNKGRRSHGTSARSNAVTEIKIAIVKKSRTLSCSPEL